jgi:Zn-dependent M28 family amino/carboxypeptidase
MSVIKVLMIVWFCLLPLCSLAESIDESLQAEASELMAASLESNLGYDIVESLTTEVGQRLAGSEAEARARDWGVKKLEALGFENVRIETFPVTFWERHAEVAEITAPFPQQLVITALGGSVATKPGGVVGEIVRFPTMQSLRDAPMGGLQGKIVFVDEFMTRTQDGSGYGAAVQKRSGAANEAGRRGALAALIRSVGTDHHRFPHTGQMRYEESVAKVPIAALSPPDADQLNRALTHGEVEVKLMLDVTSPGERQSGNVIGEIPGMTDEVVIIGGHLDSWDLGTGAVDDGAGIGITVGDTKTHYQSSYVWC